MFHLCFSYVCCKCVYHMFHAFVANVFWMLHTCYKGFQVFHVFFASVSDVYFKCFICLQTHVVNVSSRYFKSRSGVAHVAMAPVAGGQRPAAGLRLLPRAFLAWRASPSPPHPFPFLLSISLRWFELDEKPYPTSTQTPTKVVAPGGPTAARCSRSGPGAS
jgi:hypothetical protein